MIHDQIHLGGTARSPQDVRALYELGLHFAEIPITNPAEFSPLVKTYRSLKNAIGLHYICHGPREGDPNNTKTLEEVYFPKIEAILTIMTSLDMPLLTIHLWLDSRFVSERVITFKIALLKKITERAGEAGVTVCLENLSEKVADMQRAFKEIPELCLTLDLGHAQLLTKENRSFGFIHNLPERIKHVHMHDNRGGHSYRDDIHLPPGEGVVDFKEIIKSLKGIGYVRTITLELTPAEIGRCLPYVRDLVQ
jgi:sugar phosphate isomerase/epimerase